MFRGTSFHSIDSKGRIKIPSRFKEVIKADGSEGIIVSKLDKGLVGYTFTKWQEVEARIMAVAESSDNMRRFRRIFAGGAFPCECDKQDRILIPSLLRKYAGIEKEIVLVGVLDHFEIWSQKNWENEDQALEEDMKKEGVRNEIAKLGL
jgi:MraZ protein